MENQIVALVEGWDGWAVVNYAGGRVQAASPSIGYFPRFTAAPVEAPLDAAQIERIVGELRAGVMADDPRPPVFVAVPLGAYVDLETGEVCGAPDILDAREAGALWRSVAAGALASIVADARARYVEGVTFKGEAHFEAAARAEEEARREFDALLVDRECITRLAAYADVANAAQLARSVREAIEDAQAEIEAHALISNVIGDVELWAEPGQTTSERFKTAGGELWRLRKEQTRRVAVHLSRHASRLFDVYADGFTAEIERYTVTVELATRSGEIAQTVRCSRDDRSGALLVSAVLVDAWQLCDGDEIRRDRACVDYLAVAHSIITNGVRLSSSGDRYHVHDPDGILFNRRPRVIWR